MWSARAVNDALNADMRARGTTWPDHIANPGAFLASRLRRLSWSPPETAPKKAGGCVAAASIDQTPRPVVLTDAARARITAAREEIRRVLTERAQRSREEHTSSPPAASPRRDIGLSVQALHGGAMNRPAADHRAVRGDAMERTVERSGRRRA
ncbi:Putative replication protein RepA [Mycobacteroides abscessus subsp. abscessus]|nr:Putative replication protein RepA [Mycobacteroides abscessus subsp. abscessus]